MIILLFTILQSCTGCISSGCTPSVCAGRCGCPTEPEEAPIDYYLPIMIIIGILLIFYFLNRNKYKGYKNQ